MAIVMTHPRFKGAGKKLDAWDYGRIAKRLGVKEDELRAVVEVEASGSGFDRAGRVKMLFEPHIFHRELPPNKVSRAVDQRLASRRWGEIPYLTDSYPRLEAAMRIDRPAALRSASWGMGQIMGFNAKAAGYTNAAEMIDDFSDDEEKHIEAMVTFIITEGLDDDLQRHDWSGFARGYNGSAYAKHGYHTKLAAAYAKWRKRPDVAPPK